MVCANCLSLPIDGVFPTARRTEDCTVVGETTVEPFGFIKLIYKFSYGARCNPDFSWLVSSLKLSFI